MSERQDGQQDSVNGGWGKPTFGSTFLPGVPPWFAQVVAALLPPGMVEPPTLAENLLDLARVTLYPRDQIVVPTAYCCENLAMVKLALDLSRRRGDFILRAVVEGWNRARLIREMY